MKITWQHRNGSLYTTQHDTFGHITAVAGPLDWDNPEVGSDNDNGDAAQIEWAEQQIRRHAMHQLRRAVA